MEVTEIKHQIELLKKAYTSLQEGMEKKGFSDLERDGIIQRFEYTIEMTWKTLKKVLTYEGSDDSLFPREIIKEFGKKGIIKDPKLFLDFLDLRNNTSHNYDEYMVEEMFEFIQEHYRAFGELIETIETRILL